MKLKIKMPSKQFEVEIEPSASVADLRKVVASAVEKKEEQMVLIFGGKILKDTDTVETHGIKDGQAVHLVVKQPRQEDPKPEPKAEPASTPASTATTTSGSATANSSTGARPAADSTNPFAALAGGMAGSGGLGGTNVHQQAQQMMQNPQAMQEMMNSPIMQAIMDNPEVMQSIIQSNPQMRQLMETNPEIGHILNNPEHMRQAMEMMRNPSMMQEMMRNQDRALSNLESLPGGFNALQRFYNEVQEPMQNAMGRPNPFATPTNDNNTTTENTQAGTQNNEALPNPWATPTQANTGNTGAAAGGAGGLPGMGGLGAAAGLDPGMMRAMMGMMRNNPQLMRQALNAAPGFQGANISDEQLAQVAQQMADPATLEAMSNPRVLEAFQQIQRAHEVIRQEAPGLLTMMGGPGMAGATGASPAATGAGTVPAAGGNDFMANMLRSMGGMGGLGGAGAGIPPVANPEEHYASQLEQLEMMGFTDRAANIEELQRTQGNVEAAVDRLLARPR